MKKILLICLCLVIAVSLVSMTTTADADTHDIRVILDGVELEFDVPPVIINDRTMVPMRAIFEALGAEVEWYEDEYSKAVIDSRGIRVTWHLGPQTIIARPKQEFPFQKLVLRIGDSNMTTVVTVDHDLHWWIDLDVPPMIVDNRTLVPLRAIAQGLGAHVFWHSDTRMVVIETRDYVLIEPPSGLETIIDYQLVGTWYWFENNDGAPAIEKIVFFENGTGVAIGGLRQEYFIWEAQDGVFRLIETLDNPLIFELGYYIDGNILTFYDDTGKDIFQRVTQPIERNDTYAN